MAMSSPTMADAGVSAPVPGASSHEAQASAPSRSRRPLILGGLGALAVAAGLAYYVRSTHYEETDDAQVDGNMSDVSPRVAGNVSSVHVVENQTVKEGDLLAEIDPIDLQIAVAQAKAQVAQAQAQLDAEDPSVPILVSSNASALSSAQSDLSGGASSLAAARKDVEQITAQLAQAVANDRTAQLEKERSEKLVAQGAVSQSDFDLRSNTAAASSANVSALQQALAGARDRVGEKQAQIAAIESHLGEIKSNSPRQVATRKASVAIRQAELDLANAQLAQAERNLGYARIVAPVSGVVAKKSIAVGDRVTPGQQVIAIAQTDGLWVTADYRETQLEKVRPGEATQVHVDALDADLRGTVESIGGATGSKLSVLPPENASGNYVKVVQRIPVRVRLDPGQPGLDKLRIGMSVESRITVL
jgi:membrane fusion protein (multidrug efflux system)